MTKDLQKTTTMKHALFTLMLVGFCATAFAQSDYYVKQGDFDRATSNVKWASDAADRAKSQAKWANEARDNARDRMRWARDAMDRVK